MFTFIFLMADAKLSLRGFCNILQGLAKLATYCKALFDLNYPGGSTHREWWVISGDYYMYIF